MNAYNIIDKKKKGQALNKEEISFMVEGLMSGQVADCQFSAFLMAIYFQGMDDKELADLTVAMRDSGQVLSHDFIEAKTVDKHSTGGVGDKTTLIVIPIVASAGVPIYKMSGRGLGHTGGTLDKLESIPGFKIELEEEEIEKIVSEVGAAIIGQTADLAPADKEIYALRDVTATVDSIPLIASSIMSKKLASGCDALVLDVKLGSGAFMKTEEDARDLAQRMVAIGTSQGVDTTAIITNMDQPLGKAVGNRLELREVIESLKGHGPQDLMEVSLDLAAHMVHYGLGKTLDEARAMAMEELESGRALDKFYQIIQAQGGDIQALEDLQAFTQAAWIQDVHYEEEGYVTSIDAETIGLASKALGSGRDRLEDDLDYQAGIYLHKKVGDKVDAGDKVMTLYTSDKTKLAPALQTAISAYQIGQKPHKPEVIIEVIDG